MIEGDLLKKKRIEKAKMTLGIRIRVFFALILCGAIIMTLFYNFVYNLKQIRELEEKKVQLNNEKITLKEEEEKLKSDVEKLKDPEYIARYVREKYLYSKDGELIIRIEE